MDNFCTVEADTVSRETPNGTTRIMLRNSPWADQPEIKSVICFLTRLWKASHILNNFDKLREAVTQRPDENPVFFAHFTEAILQYTKPDSKSQEGILVLNSHFLSQLVSDIGKKVKVLDYVPQTPQKYLFNMAFKVINGREEQVKIHKASCDSSWQLPLDLFQRRWRGTIPTAAFFKCGKSSHWTKDCPSLPQPP